MDERSNQGFAQLHRVGRKGVMPDETINAPIPVKSLDELWPPNEITSNRRERSTACRIPCDVIQLASARIVGDDAISAELLVEIESLHDVFAA